MACETPCTGGGVGPTTTTFGRNAGFSGRLLRIALVTIRVTRQIRPQAQPHDTYHITPPDVLPLGRLAITQTTSLPNAIVRLYCFLSLWLRMFPPIRKRALTSRSQFDYMGWFDPSRHEAVQDVSPHRLERSGIRGMPATNRVCRTEAPVDRGGLGPPQADAFSLIPARAKVLNGLTPPGYLAQRCPTFRLTRSLYTSCAANSGRTIITAGRSIWRTDRGLYHPLETANH